MSNGIPASEYVTESIKGAVYDLPGGTLLVIGTVPECLAAEAPVLTGTLYIQYAVPPFNPGREPVIVGLMAGEKGGFLTGREAWDFVYNQFARFPRADIIGLTPTGAAIEFFVRELDFGIAPHVLVYTSPTPDEPLAELTHLYAPDATEENPIPELLALYVSRLNTPAEVAALCEPAEPS